MSTIITWLSFRSLPCAWLELCACTHGLCRCKSVWDLHVLFHLSFYSLSEILSLNLISLPSYTVHGIGQVIIYSTSRLSPIDHVITPHRYFLVSLCHICCLPILTQETATYVAETSMPGRSLQCIKASGSLISSHIQNNPKSTYSNWIKCTNHCTYRLQLRLQICILFTQSHLRSLIWSSTVPANMYNGSQKRYYIITTGCLVLATTTHLLYL